MCPLCIGYAKSYWFFILFHFIFLDSFCCNGQAAPQQNYVQPAATASVAPPQQAAVTAAPQAYYGTYYWSWGRYIVIVSFVYNALYLTLRLVPAVFWVNGYGASDRQSTEETTVKVAGWVWLWKGARALCRCFSSSRYIIDCDLSDKRWVVVRPGSVASLQSVVVEFGKSNLSLF